MSSVLLPNGKQGHTSNLDHYRLLNMLRHWFSTPPIRHTLYREKVMPTDDALLWRIAEGKITKAECAAVARPIMLSKACRRVIAQVLTSHYGCDFRTVVKELKQYAQEVKLWASAADAGLVLPDDRPSPPSKPEPLIVIPD